MKRNKKNVRRLNVGPLLTKHCRFSFERRRTHKEELTQQQRTNESESAKTKMTMRTKSECSSCGSIRRRVTATTSRALFECSRVNRRRSKQRTRRRNHNRTQSFHRYRPNQQTQDHLLYSTWTRLIWLGGQLRQITNRASAIRTRFSTKRIVRVRFVRCVPSHWLPTLPLSLSLSTVKQKQKLLR